MAPCLSKSLLRKTLSCKGSGKRWTPQSQIPQTQVGAGKPKNNSDLTTLFALLYNQMVVEPQSYAMPPSERPAPPSAPPAAPPPPPILARLASGQPSVNELAEPFSMS